MKDLLQEDTITIKHRSFSRDSAGRASTSVTGAEQIPGSIQPANGHEVELVDEGERTGDHIKAYVRNSGAVEAADENSTGAPGDLIVYKGEEYKVVQTRTYDMTIPHTKAVAKKVE